MDIDLTCETYRDHVSELAVIILVLMWYHTLVWGGVGLMMCGAGCPR